MLGTIPLVFKITILVIIVLVMLAFQWPQFFEKILGLFKAAKNNIPDKKDDKNYQYEMICPNCEQEQLIKIPYGMTIVLARQKLICPECGCKLNNAKLKR
jgi:hypothetical protein